MRKPRPTIAARVQALLVEFGMDDGEEPTPLEWQLAREILRLETQLGVYRTMCLALDAQRRGTA